MFGIFRLKKTTRGSTLIEYALIAAMLSAMLYSAYSKMGTSYRDLFIKISTAFDNAIGNKEQ